MAEKTDYTWYVRDKAYFVINKSNDKAVSTAKETRYFKDLITFGQFDNEPIGVARRIDKFLCLNDVYAYMYNQGYLSDSRYVMDTFYDEDEHCYSFVLNVTKLSEDYDIEDELCSHFPYKFSKQYIHMLFNPLSYHKCRTCGAYVFSSTYDAGKLDDNKRRCDCCKDLNREQTKAIKALRASEGVLAAMHADKQMESQLCA